MSAGGYAIGLTGSTTESIAALATVDGDIVAVARGDGLNLQEMSVVNFYDALQGILRDLLDRGPRGWENQCRAVWCGIEGVLSDYDIQIVDQCLANTYLARGELALGRNLTISKERGVAVHAATFWRSPGIVLKVGTGAFAYGVDSEGATARAGGWGPHTDADGGGYWIGRSSLVHILLDFDGRREVNDEFKREILTALAADDALAVISWVNQIKERTQLRRRIARVARIVAEQADDNNNATSVEILRDSAGRILASLLAVRAKLQYLDSAPVCLQGSLVQHCSTLAQHLHSSISQSSLGMHPVKGRFRPVVGATSLALASIDNPGAVQTLRRAADDSSEDARKLLILEYSDPIDKMMENDG